MEEKYLELTTNNKIIRGMYHKIHDSKKSPCVIMYHGFQGNRTGPRKLFVDFSRYLAGKGIASIRFDFTGSGESEGEFVDMTFSSEREDALFIYDYAASLDEIDNEKIFILGHSMGGSVGGSIAHIRNICGLVLWSPAGDLKYALDNFDFPDGQIPFPLDFKGQLVGKDFFDDVINLDLKSDAEKYTGKSLLFCGDKDDLVPCYVSEKYKEWLNTELIKVSGADHNYNNYLARKYLFSKTRDFISGLI